MSAGVCGSQRDSLGGKKVNPEVFRNKINIFKPSCCGNKWPFRMFRKYLHNNCYLWLLIESLCSIWNAIEKFCIWKVIENFGIKVCSSIALSHSKSFLVCLSAISHTCIFYMQRVELSKWVLCSCDFAIFDLIPSNAFILILYLLFMLYFFYFFFYSNYDFFYVEHTSFVNLLCKDRIYCIYDEIHEFFIFILYLYQTMYT